VAQLGEEAAPNFVVNANLCSKTNTFRTFMTKKVFFDWGFLYPTLRLGSSLVVRVLRTEFV